MAGSSSVTFIIPVQSSSRRSITGRWNTMARGALRDDLYAAHAALVCEVMKATGPGTPDERLAEWAERNGDAVQRTTQTLTEIWETERSTLATLSVAVRAVRSLVASGAQPVHS